MDDSPHLPAEALSEGPGAKKSSPVTRVHDLAAELAEIREREANSRLQAAREFVRVRAEFEKLRAKVDETKQDRETLVEELETFTRLLATAEDEKGALLQKVARLQSSFSWKITQPWRVLVRVFKPKAKKTVVPPAVAPDADFLYYIHTTPFRIHRENTLRLRGWLLSRTDRRIAGIRTFVDERAFMGVYGFEEVELMRVHPTLKRNPQPGFEVEMELPPGRHQLKFEALLGEDCWKLFFSAPIWRL